MLAISQEHGRPHRVPREEDTGQPGPIGLPSLSGVRSSRPPAHTCSHLLTCSPRSVRRPCCGSRHPPAVNPAFRAHGQKPSATQREPEPTQPRNPQAPDNLDVFRGNILGLFFLSRIGRETAVCRFPPLGASGLAGRSEGRGEAGRAGGEGRGSPPPCSFLARPPPPPPRSAQRNSPSFFGSRGGPRAEGREPATLKGTLQGMELACSTQAFESDFTFCLKGGGGRGRVMRGISLRWA